MRRVRIGERRGWKKESGERRAMMEERAARGRGRRRGWLVWKSERARKE